MIFTVIIPTYNRGERLLLCLDAFSRQTLARTDFEVIVVNDGSTDRTVELVGGRSFPFQFRLVTQKNAGAGKARNAGAAMAKGDFLAFCEDDVIPDSQWLHRASECLSANPSLDVLEGRTVYETTGAEVRRFDVGGIPSFIPCNLIVRRTLFEKSGGYDPAFYDKTAHRYFREDADLGFRLMELGAKIALVRDLLVSHPKQFHTFGDALRHVKRYEFDPLLYKKHPRKFRTMIEIKMVMGIRLRRPQHTVALIEAMVVLWMFLSLLSESPVWPGSILGVVVVCGMLFQYKYQGRGMMRRLWELPAFVVLPGVYLGAVIKGSLRYKSFGSLLP